MKKTLLLSTILSLLLTSCFSPVFYKITQDVPPEEATVSGIVNSLVRYNVSGTEFLVLSADGGIRYKNASDSTHSEWYKYESLPFSLHKFDFETNTHTGEAIIKLFADSSYLYMLSTTYTINDDISLSVPDVVSVYSKQITLGADGLWSLEGEWTKVVSGTDYFKFSIKNEYCYSDFNAFCTNSVKPENRKAYLRSGNTESYNEQNKATTYYELKGTKIEAITPISFESTNGIETKSKNINNAAILNGTVIYFNAIGVTTNETLQTDATYIYFGKNESLLYTNGTGYTEAIKNCGSPISSLAPCSDSLLIGRGDYSDTINYTTGGITKTSLSNGIPGTELTKFTTNADIQLSTSYFILTLINTDPSKTELDSTLYASVGFIGAGSSATAGVNYKNIGLWSYYPSRGNWNRE